VQDSSVLADAIVAVPALPISLDIRRVPASATQLRLEWTGGRPPYQIEATNDASTGSWQNLGAPVFDTSAVVGVTGVRRFFRVKGS
jgi:hypothetical protein